MNEVNVRRWHNRAREVRDMALVEAFDEVSKDWDEKQKYLTSVICSVAAQDVVAQAAGVQSPLADLMHQRILAAAIERFKELGGEREGIVAPPTEALSAVNEAIYGVTKAFLEEFPEEKDNDAAAYMLVGSSLYALRSGCYDEPDDIARMLVHRATIIGAGLPMGSTVDKLLVN